MRKSTGSFTKGRWSDEAVGWRRKAGDEMKVGEALLGKAGKVQPKPPWKAEAFRAETKTRPSRRRSTARYEAGGVRKRIVWTIERYLKVERTVDSCNLKPSRTTALAQLSAIRPEIMPSVEWY